MLKKQYSPGRLNTPNSNGSSQACVTFKSPLTTIWPMFSGRENVLLIFSRSRAVVRRARSCGRSLFAGDPASAAGGGGVDFFFVPVSVDSLGARKEERRERQETLWVIWVSGEESEAPDRYAARASRAEPKE
jgi:hypothetical protein